MYQTHTHTHTHTSACACHLFLKYTILLCRFPPQILHTLTARAIIRDWQNGLLAPNKIEHEVKYDLISLLILDQLTSYQ